MMIHNEIYDIVKHSGNITLDQVIKVAKILRERSYANKLSGTVKEVLGTCQYIIYLSYFID